MAAKKKKNSHDEIQSTKFISLRFHYLGNIQRCPSLAQEFGSRISGHKDGCRSAAEFCHRVVALPQGMFECSVDCSCFHTPWSTCIHTILISIDSHECSEGVLVLARQPCLISRKCDGESL